MTIHIPAETALALATALLDVPCALSVKREAVACAIEQLIAFLDSTEPDCDLEPSLGFSPYNDRVETTDLEGDFADWELDQDSEDGGDDEEAHCDLPAELKDDRPAGVAA